MDSWLINGVAGDVVSVNDRGLAYGDGLFETIAVREGQARFLDDHLARLQSGCERLSIAPPDPSALRHDVAALIEGYDHAAAKIIVTRGAGKRGYSGASASQPLRLVGVAATAPAAATHYTEGVHVRRCTTTISRNPSLAGLKTLNRLEQVLARSEWTDASIAEGLMFDEAGSLICGTMSNVFLVVDDVLLTPELTASGIHGLMRQRLLNCTSNAGIPIEQVPVSESMLKQASELMVSNSLIGLWPVRSLDEQQFESREFTSKLMRLLATNGVSECRVTADE